ncbi:uncharacterized protein SPAPADRAFT_61227, partial [Spathaspora passalidarum NRRL Y-27907]
GYVFTHKDYRGKGLAERCISSAIEYTEREIVKSYVAGNGTTIPDSMNVDSFKNMVLDSDGNVDYELANYYLGKQYFWMLYSGVNTYYQRFGFKGYPLDFYKIPTSLLTKAQEKVIVELIKGSTSDESEKLMGKSLKLLRADNQSDQDIIKFILQTKELQMITELNKLTFHSKLQHSQKSSSSLLNMKDALSMTPKPDSGSSEEFVLGHANSYPSPTMTPPSVQNNQTIPKIAIKPSYETFQWNVRVEQCDAQPKYNPDNPHSVDFTNIQGAIITNELQQRSYYILWNTLMHAQFFILGMGEIKFDTGHPRRRGSSLASLSALNELGGYNFQDLDILFSTAMYVAKQRDHKLEHISVSVNDVPDEIPDAVMYDFFMNYLPMTTSFESQEVNQSVQTKDRGKVELIKNAAKQMEFLPMLKKFGTKNHEFDLDWIYSGMLSWG